MAGGARVVIGADVKEVQPAIDSVVRSVQQGATQVNGSFQGWVGNTNQVATATEKLERQMKGFASEQRTQGRMARFYASELASIIPAAGGAKTALEGLLGIGIEGLAGGLGIGVAFEAVKFSIQMVSDEMKRSEAVTKSLADASLATATIIEKGWERVREQMGGVTEGTKKFRDALKDAQPEIDKAFKAYVDVQESGPGILARINQYIGPGEAGHAFDKWVAERARASQEFAAAVSAAVNQADISRALAEEQAKAAQAHMADSVIAKDNEEKAKKAAAERLKIEEAILRAKNGWMTVLGPGNFAGEDQFKTDQANAKTESQWDPMFGPGNAQGAMEFDDKLKSINQESSQMQELWGSIGGSVGSAFNSIGAAVGGTAGKILSWLGQMITQAIQLAIAMAAASSAWATPLGAVAIGALVAAGLLGLVASVGARADGGPISAMQPYLVGERGPELIVPGQSGTVVPNHALGGATTINIHATDAQSFERMLRRHDNELVRVLRDANRAGRGV